MLHRLGRALFASAIGLALLAGHPARALAQGPTVITGKVTNESGAPVGTASVSIDLLKVTTLTREDGSYTLTAPAGRTGPALITVRRIGFKSSQRTVSLAGAPMTQAFTLESQAIQLTGIVVTALSVSREKSTIGTSQQEVTAEDLTRTQVPNVISSMSGKVSGVTITGNGNMGGSARIVIRGQGSILGNNQPLFIVDGIPVSNAGFSTASASGGRDYGNAIADLDPNDISSMTVLKGPNAAALYGSRASNGAVVITTKSGRSVGDATKFTLTSRGTIDQISIIP
jgi:TonB-dependent SusC/RagA subfamily outer membrane receptor